MTTRASTTRRSPRRHLGAWVVALFNADRAPESPIGDQARFSRGRRLISPAFRSEIRCGGSVRLSGDSFRCAKGMTYAKSLGDLAGARIQWPEFIDWTDDDKGEIEVQVSAGGEPVVTLRTWPE